MDVISHPASIADLILRLSIATACGAAIGANREFRRKPAGLRTHALVGLGAAVLTIIGLQMETDPGQLNALSRVVQGLIVGVGFIGGGAIIHRDSRPVEGVSVEGISTAASIWVVAAAGTAAGAGMLFTAAVSIALALFILVAGEPLDRAIRSRRTNGAGDDLP